MNTAVFYLDQKLFLTQNFFGIRIFLDQNVFGPKIFFGSKFFGHKIFLDSNTYCLHWQSFFSIVTLPSKQTLFYENIFVYLLLMMLISSWSLLWESPAITVDRKVWKSDLSLLPSSSRLTSSCGILEKVLGSFAPRLSRDKDRK